MGSIIDIILLAMLAAFVFLRLRSVLGQRTGHEKSPEDRKKEREGHLRLVDDPPANDQNDPFVPGPDPVSLKKLSRTSRDAIDDALKVEPHLDLAMFMSGAENAYGMILEA